jgi:hypothetical protein
MRRGYTSRLYVEATTIYVEAIRRGLVEAIRRGYTSRLSIYVEAIYVEAIYVEARLRLYVIRRG